MLTHQSVHLTHNSLAFLRVKSQYPQILMMEEDTVLNPPVRDAELVLCFHYNEKIMFRNLARHNSRNHSDKDICWTVPHLKIWKLSSFCKPKTEHKQKQPEEPSKEENVQNESVNIEPNSLPKKTHVRNLFFSVFKKRKRQPNIFETFGHLSRLKNEIEELIVSITDPSTVDYLQKISNVLTRTEQTEVELLHEKKKCKYVKEWFHIMSKTLEETMQERVELK